LLVGGYFYLDSKLGEIRRIAVPALTPEKPGQPIDILVIGSDSRSFVNNPSQARAFGSKATQTGQRSDVSIVMRLVPGSSRIEMLSIPRDTWVPIAGTGGSNKINSAFNNGPNQLVETIQHDFKIPINHVMVANFPGFTGMVNSLGGLMLDFPMPVRDAYSGLNIQQTGCQSVDGQQALALVRSRHLYYYEKGSWHYDGMSDWSRIRRQQAFFHALMDRVSSTFPNVFRLNSFLGATVSDLSVDSKFSSSEMISLGMRYHSINSSDLVTSVLPTTPSVINGEDVLLPAEPYAETTIAHFLSGGSTTSALAPGLPAWTGHGRARLASSGGSPPPGVVTDTPQSLPEPWNPTPC
jgi:LCP family protein required for cell wall assembly